MPDSKRVPSIDEVPPDESLATTALDNATEDEAWYQGAWAYSFAVDQSENPYAPNTSVRGEWDEGWTQAEMDDEG